MANDYNVGISERIKELEKAHGYTDYKLAQELEVSHANISQTFAGRQAWSTKLLIKVSRLFQVSLDWLVWGKEFNETEQLTRMRKELIEAKTLYQKLRVDYNILKKSFQIYLGKKEKEEN